MLILGERYRRQLESGLPPWIQDVYWLPDNPAVDERLAGHADLSVFVYGGSAVIARGEIFASLVNILTNDGLKVFRSEVQGKSYPKDAGLCVCTVGRHIICNPKTTDPAVHRILTGPIIEASQGYTKCSICVVTEDAIITSDHVIADKAACKGLDVLCIQPGHVILEGFNEGFIGGSTFLLEDHTLAFTGNLDDHPDKDRILDFIRLHGVQPVFLTQEPIFDIGGGIKLP